MRKAVMECLKYSVKGNQLVAMKGAVAPVIRAIDRGRLVIPWGSFYNHPAIKRERPAPAMCKCGCSDWMLEKVVDSIVTKIRGQRLNRR